MASTISTPQFGTFKHVRMRYIAVAAGVALATAAVAGGFMLRDNAATAPTSVAPITVSDQNPGAYPLVQEMSHPQAVPPAGATSDVTKGAFPLVQEMSHPAVPTAASDSTTEMGAYPRVQEMSHPQIKSEVGFDGAPITTKTVTTKTEIYLVGSLGQKAAVEQDLAASDGETLREYWVIDSLESEEGLALLNAELAQFGDGTVELIDLR
jgi:hypothetical protein